MSKKIFAAGILIGIVISCCFFYFYISATLPQVNADCTDEICADPPCCNGDVNGDGDIDISDAIGLLTYLFNDGLPPQNVICRNFEVHKLPATGQTTCYDDDWNKISCNSADYPGQDGYYQLGCPTENRFIDNGDGTVTDKCTGLMWQKETADVNNDGEPSWGDDLPWNLALIYCDNLILCNDGAWISSSQAGLIPSPDLISQHRGVKYDNWRLPNIKELYSLVNYRYGNGIDPIFNSGFMFYWSSTTDIDYKTNAYFVDFWGGEIRTHKKLTFEDYYIFAVRTIQPGE